MSNTDCRKIELLERIPFAMFIYYKIATFIPAFIGMYAIYRYGESSLWVFGYVLTFLIHVSIVYRIKCPHCTYYQLPGKKLQCMWLWGIPKIYRENPNPESPLNRVYVPVGMAVVMFFPVYWLLSNLLLLVLYFVFTAVMVASLFMSTCSRCTYFGCTHNRVPKEVKGRYKNERPCCK
jgi:hypothetical protein